MNSEVRIMLDKTYRLFCNKFDDRTKAWDNFIEFLAVDHRCQLLYELDHKFEWFMDDNALVKAVSQVYDPQLLKSDLYDHLGDIYQQQVITETEAKAKGMFLAPPEAGGMLSDMCFSETEESGNILDPTVGTGRLLMAVHAIAPNAKLFGVDKDVTYLKIALTNFAIHDIKGYLLNADSLYHETDISKVNGKYNWQYANRWPSYIEQLKPRQQQTQEELPLT